MTGSSVSDAVLANYTAELARLQAQVSAMRPGAPLPKFLSGGVEPGAVCAGPATRTDVGVYYS